MESCRFVWCRNYGRRSIFVVGATFNTELCLSDGTYTFTIDDSYGDGIFGEGYTILVNGNVVATGNAFIWFPSNRNLHRRKRW